MNTQSSIEGILKIPKVVCEHTFLDNALREFDTDEKPIIDKLNDYFIYRFIYTKRTEKISATTYQVYNAVIQEIPFSQRRSDTVQLTFDAMDIYELKPTIRNWESTIKLAVNLSTIKLYDVILLSIVRKERQRERIAKFLQLPDMSEKRTDDSIPFKFLNPNETMEYLEKNDNKFKEVKKYIEDLH